MTSAAPGPSRAAASATAQPDAASTVLVVDDSQLFRDMICKEFRGQGFTVCTANDGHAGLIQLAKQPVGVIILDYEMPKMNGLEFLKALRADKRWSTLPVVMLSACVARPMIVEAMRCKIFGYVMKERLAMPEVVARVQAALRQHQAAPTESSGGHPAMKHTPLQASSTQSVSAPNLVTRETTLAAIAEADGTRTLAGVVKQVTAIAESSKASAAEIASIVRQDPVLAARVIQLAKSSAYAGSKSRLASVDDAVRTVGVAAIRDLAVSLGVFSAFPADRADGIDLLRCWHHAFAVSAVMSRIVPKTDTVPPGLPHLVGLCHDLVEIVLRQKFPSEYAAAEDYAEQAGVPTLRLLPPVFGVSYPELTRSFLERLKFPPQVSEPINEFLGQAIESTPDAYKSTLARALAIANLVAHGMLLTSSLDNLVSPVSLIDCRSALLPSAPLNAAEIRSEAITTVCLLADLAADQEQAMSKPLLPRRDTMLLYLRHPAFAPLDPLEIALKSIAKTDLREKFPAAEDLAGFDGIVAVAPASTDPMLSNIARQRSLMTRPIPLLKLSAASGATSVDAGPATDQTAVYPLSLQTLGKFSATLRART